jgi:dihydrofolate synthase/folylpolyglutamate synthase
MTYPDALSYLGQTRRFGMKLGLESMRELALGLRNPQDRLRFIHIAGTNGKGSTAAFCESILRAAGYRVGLYTSPHLVSVRERIQINRAPIPEADFAEGMTVVGNAVAKNLEQEPTFFEITTALALWYFEREKVDWVVWETGLGGRLDATNIVTPEVCIITNIGLEHQQYLGESLAEIAAEKAGIMKPRVPVVSAVGNTEAAIVIRKSAKELCSPLTMVIDELKPKDCGFDGMTQMAGIGCRLQELGMIGRHQVLNAACAVAAIDILRERAGDEELRDKLWGPDNLWDDWYSDPVNRGLKFASWPGRFEILSEKPLIVLDGAHNSAGMKMLVETWRTFLAARFGWNEKEIEGRARIVFASVIDKDISEMAAQLRPLAKEVSLVRLANERGAEPTTLTASFTGINCTCYESVSDVWQSMMTDAESIILVTGSLFLVGEMLARRQGNTEEYRLNERLEKFTASR